MIEKYMFYSEFSKTTFPDVSPKKAETYLMRIVFQTFNKVSNMSINA